MRPELVVASVQLTSSTDVEDNLRRVEVHLRAAAGAGARMVVLPENFGFLARDEAKLAHAQEVDTGAHTARLRHLAREFDLWVVAGSIPERAPDPARTFNTCVVIDPRGETVACYRKIHLFDIDLADGTSFRESAAVAPGDAPVVVDVDGWAVGLSICYDLRFPELYRLLSAQGARVLLVPAAFTLQTGKDHWDTLLRARAIENSAFVVASGQWGHHGGGRVSWGKSQIIDPWGTVLARVPEREGFCVATLQASDQDRVRRDLPCLRHRRLR